MQNKLDIEKLVIQAMSYISSNKDLPVGLAKQLMGRMVLFRANNIWLKDVVAGMLSETRDAAFKAEGLIENVQGAFTDEKDIYLQAYMACTNQGIQGEALKKENLTVVKGGKNGD